MSDGTGTTPPPGNSSEEGASDSRTKSKSTESWTGLPPSTTTTNSSSPSSWSSADLDSMWESMVKVTLASFGGSLVGLALENQRRHHPHEHQHRPQQSLPPSKPAEQPQRPTRRKRPPTRVSSHAVAAATTSSIPSRAAALPGQWALSCLLFATAMEASRRASPTTLLLKAMTSPAAASADEGSGDGEPPLLIPAPPDYRTAFLTSFGDYAAGGAASGMAGGWALASRQPSSASAAAATASLGSFSRQVPLLTKRAGLAWGLRVGAALGAAAGIVQAGVDVAGLLYASTTTQHPIGPAKPSSSSSSPQPPLSVSTARGAPGKEGAERRAG